jgi:hypothetical protein
MSQRTIGGRTFLIIRYKGNRHFTVSEECTKREAGCKPHRHFHMIGESRTKDEAIATLEEAYGDKPPAPRYELPVCPDCGERVVASLCGTKPTGAESQQALNDILLAMHRKLAHETVAS